MKVKDVMIKEVVSLAPQDTVKKAMGVLFKMQISGLPVIDAQGQLAGMFTEKSVLSRILPGYIEKVGRFVYEDDPKSIMNKLIEIQDLEVAQLMRREVLTTGEDSSLCEAAHIMLLERARRLPVVNAAKKVVGIIARCDILKTFFTQAGGV